MAGLVKGPPHHSPPRGWGVSCGAAWGSIWAITLFSETSTPLGAAFCFIWVGSVSINSGVAPRLQRELGQPGPASGAGGAPGRG